MVTFIREAMRRGGVKTGGAGPYRRLNEVQIEDEPKWWLLREQQQRLMADD